MKDMSRESGFSMWSSEVLSLEPKVGAVARGGGVNGGFELGKEAGGLDCVSELGEDRYTVRVGTGRSSNFLVGGHFSDGML